MRLTTRIPLVGALGISLLGAALTQNLVATLRPAPLTIPARPARPAGPVSPEEAALRRARWSRMLAQQAANREREALEAWDQPGTAALDPERWRLQIMAHDRTGELRRAQVEASRAAALARSPQDSSRAAALLALIEHDLGHHDAELEQARRLIALQPDGYRSQLLLLRARRCGALCSGRESASPG